jgi:hypothetical protein
MNEPEEVQGIHYFFNGLVSECMAALGPMRVQFLVFDEQEMPADFAAETERLGIEVLHVKHTPKATVTG